MTLTIELSGELEAALLAQAQAQGVSVGRFASRVIERALAGTTEREGDPGPPFETERGMLAKYGPAPSAEEIDANRAEMFRGFAQDF
jgi:hypothetical protein